MALPGAEVIERAGLSAWPALETEFDGGWVRRAANGYTKRANSVQSLDPADDRDIGPRLEAASDWYRQRNLPPVFRVTPLAAPAVIAELDARGWVSFDHSQLLAMALGPIVADPRAEVLAPTSEDFLSAQHELQRYDLATREKLRAVASALTVPAAGIVLRASNGNAVASALMSVAVGIVITGNVVTSRIERRKGYAAAMMRTGLAWGRANGAQFAALNVMTDNTPAQALYASLGYRWQYDYSYRSPAE